MPKKIEEIISYISNEKQHIPLLINATYLCTDYYTWIQKI